MRRMNWLVYNICSYVRICMWVITCAICMLFFYTMQKNSRSMWWWCWSFLRVHWRKESFFHTSFIHIPPKYAYTWYEWNWKYLGIWLEGQIAYFLFVSTPMKKDCKSTFLITVSHNSYLWIYLIKNYLLWDWLFLLSIARYLSQF